MDDDSYVNRNATVADTIERMRVERFSEIDRDLVLEILRLHADGVVADNASRLVDEAIAKRAAEAK